ncbi:unnamed protein product [Camellia sinensis]
MNVGSDLWRCFDPDLRSKSSDLDPNLRSRSKIPFERSFSSWCLRGVLHPVVSSGCVRSLVRNRGVRPWIWSWQWFCFAIGCVRVRMCAEDDPGRRWVCSTIGVEKWSWQWVLAWKWVSALGVFRCIECSVGVQMGGVVGSSRLVSRGAAVGVRKKKILGFGSARRSIVEDDDGGRSKVVGESARGNSRVEVGAVDGESGEVGADDGESAEVWALGVRQA